MRVENLKKMKDEAPKTGTLLAYARTKVLFRAYANIEEAYGLLEGKDLLELHLFDDDIEYRCLSTRSKRYKDGIIEAIIDFKENDNQTVFKEQVLLSQKAENRNDTRINVLNHVSYDEENGMAYIDNYRLQMGGE